MPEANTKQGPQPHSGYYLQLLKLETSRKINPEMKLQPSPSVSPELRRRKRL